MKIAFATIALSIAATLTACQSIAPNSTSSAVEATSMNADAKLTTILAAHTWSYQPSDSTTPIVLSFNAQNLNVATGCNNAFGAVKVKNSTLEVGRLASTMKMCEPALMAQEKFATDLFKDAKLAISVDQSEPMQPVLTLQAANGQKYQFIGTQTAETKYQGEGERIFLEVAAETKPCTGVAPQQCLQVREIKYNDSGIKTSVGEWQLFYGNIEGFEHNPNIRTVLRLKRFTLANPAADQSKYAYVHDMTVEQEMIKAK